MQSTLFQFLGQTIGRPVGDAVSLGQHENVPTETDRTPAANFDDVFDDLIVKSETEKEGQEPVLAQEKKSSPDSDTHTDKRLSALGDPKDAEVLQVPIEGQDAEPTSAKSLLITPDPIAQKQTRRTDPLENVARTSDEPQVRRVNQITLPSSENAVGPITQTPPIPKQEVEISLKKVEAAETANVVHRRLQQGASERSLAEPTRSTKTGIPLPQEGLALGSVESDYRPLRPFIKAIPVEDQQVRRNPLAVNGNVVQKSALNSAKVPQNDIPESSFLHTKQETQKIPAGSSASQEARLTTHRYPLENPPRPPQESPIPARLPSKERTGTAPSTNALQGASNVVHSLSATSIIPVAAEKLAGLNRNETTTNASNQITIPIPRNPTPPSSAEALASERIVWPIGDSETNNSKKPPLMEKALGGLTTGPELSKLNARKTNLADLPISATSQKQNPSILEIAFARPIAEPDNETVIQQVIRLKGSGPIPPRDTSVAPEHAASTLLRSPLRSDQTPAFTPPQSVAPRQTQPQTEPQRLGLPYPQNDRQAFQSTTPPSPIEKLAKPERADQIRIQNPAPNETPRPVFSGANSMIPQASDLNTVRTIPVSQEDSRSNNISSSLELPVSGRVDGSGTTTPHAHTSPNRMDLPAHVSRQIMDVIQHLPSKPVEISLNPEELGRLKLAVSTSDAGLVVNVVAERPETLDLLRRHISTLEQEFQSLGYEDVSFSFNGDAPSGSSNEEDSEQSQGFVQVGDAQSTDTPENQIHLKQEPKSGLDLRL